MYTIATKYVKNPSLKNKHLLLMINSCLLPFIPLFLVYTYTFTINVFTSSLCCNICFLFNFTGLSIEAQKDLYKCDHIFRIARHCFEFSVTNFLPSYIILDERMPFRGHITGQNDFIDSIKLLIEHPIGDRANR